MNRSREEGERDERQTAEQPELDGKMRLLSKIVYASRFVRAILAQGAC